jgi:hypothetical protein
MIDANIQMERKMNTPSNRSWLSRALLMLWSLSAVGCASVTSWQTETAPDDFVDGTHILAELVFIATREQALTGGGLMEGWREKLLAVGYSDGDIVDGSEVTVVSYCYGHNSGVPQCAHHGHYVAHVPVELRDGLRVNDDGNSETVGDLVEVELTKTAAGQLVGKIVRVHRKADDWGDCRFEFLQTGALSSTLLTLGSVGPPRAYWIECASAESDGWLRRPVRGAPPSATTLVSEWVKLPAP